MTDKSDSKPPSCEKKAELSIQDSTTDSSKLKDSSKTNWFQWILTAISTSVAVLALCFVVVVIAIDQTALSNSQQEIETLQNKLATLELALNTSNSEITTIISRQSNGLGSSITAISNMHTLLQTNLNHQLENLQRDITSSHEEISNKAADTKTSLLSQIHENITTVNNTINQLKQDILSLRELQEQTDVEVTALSAQLNSPVEIYDECTHDEKLCTLEPVSESSRFYWRTCATPWAQINMTDYYTVGAYCTYESNYKSGHLVSNMLQSDSSTNTVRCRCNVGRPSHTVNTYQFVQSNLDSVCTLVITRCPISQSITN